jgi:hypothetical protein
LLKKPLNAAGRKPTTNFIYSTGTILKKIDLTLYMKLASNIRVLNNNVLDFEKSNPRQVTLELAMFEITLDAFIKKEKEIENENILPELVDLKKSISEFLATYYTPKLPNEFDTKPFLEVSFIYKSLKVLETVLLSDLIKKHAYRVTQKDEYNPDILVNSGIKIFPKGIREKFNRQTEFDINMGLRCLAFELPTAFGFHFFRAVETLIVQLYLKRVGSDPPENRRNWDVYIKILEGKDAIKPNEPSSPEIIEMLRDLKNNHRNPLLHPEDNLDHEEAVVLLGLLKSVIYKLVKEINDLK